VIVFCVLFTVAVCSSGALISDTYDDIAFALRECIRKNCDGVLCSECLEEYVEFAAAECGNFTAQFSNSECSPYCVGYMVCRSHLITRSRNCSVEVSNLIACSNDSRFVTSIIAPSFAPIIAGTFGFIATQIGYWIVDKSLNYLLDKLNQWWQHDQAYLFNCAGDSEDSYLDLNPSTTDSQLDAMATACTKVADAALGSIFRQKKGWIGNTAVDDIWCSNYDTCIFSF